MFLECEWFHPFEGTTQKDLARVNKINAERAERCYYLNNSKVEFFIKLKEQDE